MRRGAWPHGTLPSTHLPASPKEVTMSISVMHPFEAKRCYSLHRQNTDRAGSRAAVVYLLFSVGNSLLFLERRRVAVPHIIFDANI